jgi:hypothetical protein
MEQGNIQRSSTFNHEELGLKIKGVHGTREEKERKLAKITTVISQGIGGNMPGQDLTTSLVVIKLEGLSISIANYDPREIVLLSLYRVNLIKFDVSHLTTINSYLLEQYLNGGYLQDTQQDRFQDLEYSN